MNEHKASERVIHLRNCQCVDCHIAREARKPPPPQFEMAPLQRCKHGNWRNACPECSPLR